jgi:hypothetical protein
MCASKADYAAGGAAGKRHSLTHENELHACRRRPRLLATGRPGQTPRMDQRVLEDQSLSELRRQILEASRRQRLDGHQPQAHAEHEHRGQDNLAHCSPEQQEILNSLGMDTGIELGAYPPGSMQQELFRQVASFSAPGYDRQRLPEPRQADTQQTLHNFLAGTRHNEPMAGNIGDIHWSTSRALSDLAMLLPTSLASNLGHGTHNTLPPLADRHHGSASTSHHPSNAWTDARTPSHHVSSHNPLERLPPGSGPLAHTDVLRTVQTPLHSLSGLQHAGRHPLDLALNIYSQPHAHSRSGAADAGMLGRAAPSAPHASIECTVLAAKILTESDSKHSRAILPRVAVENNLPFVVGYRTFGINIPDHEGHEWEFVIKSWANGRADKAGQSRRKDRRVYVVEQLSAYLATHRLSVGDMIGIVVVDGAHPPPSIYTTL